MKRVYSLSELRGCKYVTKITGNCNFWHRDETRTVLCCTEIIFWRNEDVTIITITLPTKPSSSHYYHYFYCYYYYYSLNAVTESVLMYGCGIWAGALKMEKYRKCMASVQRRGAHRVAYSYQTVPDPVVLVIVGVIPIDHLALCCRPKASLR